MGKGKDYKNMFSEIFNELLAENRLNKKQFAEKSGIPYTTVVGWTKLNRLPDYTALIKIADFFECSIDFLTGRQEGYGRETDIFSVSHTEQTLIKNYRTLSTDDKEIVTKLFKRLSK